MERGGIYYNKYIDSSGKDRKIPVVVLSDKGYNDSSGFATCVRMVRYVNGIPRPSHVSVPKEDMNITDPQISMETGTALAETISSVRIANMFGPIGRITDKDLMRKITEAVVKHVDGTEEAPAEEEETVTGAEPPTRGKPWYSPQIQKEQQARMTEPEYGYDGEGIMTADRTDAGSRRFGPGAEG